ncbi:MAG: hypothetical protein ABIM32_03910 [candidate division WOR-3 bacterium]
MDKDKFAKIKLLSPQLESEIIQKIRELPYSSLTTNPSRPGGDTELDNVVAPPPGIRVLYVNREMVDDTLSKGYGGADFSDQREDAPGTDNPQGYVELMKVFENIPSQHGEDIENRIDYSELDKVLKTVFEGIEKVKKNLQDTLINVLSSVYRKIGPVSSVRDLVKKAIYLQKYAEISDEEIEILVNASTRDLEYAFSLLKQAQEEEAGGGVDVPAGGEPVTDMGFAPVDLGGGAPFGGLPGLGGPATPPPTPPEEPEEKKFPTNAIEISKEQIPEDADLSEIREAFEKLNDDPFSVSDEYLQLAFAKLIDLLKEEKEEEEEEEGAEEENTATEKEAAVEDEDRENTIVLKISENVFDFIKERLGYLEYNNARNAISNVNSSLDSKDYDKAEYYFSRFCDILEKAKKEMPIKSIERAFEEEEPALDFFSLTSSKTAANKNLYYLDRTAAQLFKLLRAIPDNLGVVKEDWPIITISAVYQIPDITKPAGMEPSKHLTLQILYNIEKDSPVGIIYRSTYYPFDSASIREILRMEYGGKYIDFGIGANYGRRKKEEK